MAAGLRRLAGAAALAAAVAPVIAAPLAAADPRLRLVELQLAGRDAVALAELEAIARDAPAQSAAELGLDYLRGHLLSGLGRPAQAADAFAAAIGTRLAPYARHRLALEQQRLGHPEVAAGLVATLLASRPPAALVAPATRLLAAALAGGGDCRLLRGIPERGLEAGDRRRIDLLRADCHRRAGRTDRAGEVLLELLAEALEDDVAREAATRLAALPAAPADARLEVLLGLAFHGNREFDRSARYLEQALGRPGGIAAGVAGQDAFDVRYALLRNHFWEGRYRAAAAGFRSLGVAARDPDDAAQALYQQGRSLELLGEWAAAAQAFRHAALPAPHGETAGSALAAALRLEWRLGHEAPALELLQRLAARRAWSGPAARAALFLVSSDVVRGRGDRAAPWLALAARDAPEGEVAYWRGRLAELGGHHAEAAAAYLAVLRADPYHPLARAARRRLAEPRLAGAARALGLRLAARGRAEDLYGAWLLLGDTHPRGRAARAALLSLWGRDRRSAPFLRLREVAPPAWPLWEASLEEPEEILLALGLWGEGQPALLRHFPPAQPDLAYTAGRLLARAGETRPALYVAEVLRDRVPERLPDAFLPVGLRRLLHPFAYRDLVRRQAAARGVDPWLLLAIVREESRFDPRAVSGAAARGLAQFVVPTAARLAVKLGLGEMGPAALERPEVSLALGAAYLGELQQAFGGAVLQTVAAYNAGEPQAALWQAYCYGREPEEYYSKVAFKETRGYLEKVLRSREIYAELYGGAG